MGFDSGFLSKNMPVDNETIILNDNGELQSIVLPIGSIISWAKNLKENLQLPYGFVECSGQVLDDNESILNGIKIPNLNGENRFLRGSSETGETGGNDFNYFYQYEATDKVDTSGADTYVDDGKWIYINGQRIAGDTTRYPDNSMSTPIENKPPYYNIVWIMRIK